MSEREHELTSICNRLKNQLSQTKKTLAIKEERISDLELESKKSENVIATLQSKIG